MCIFLPLDTSFLLFPPPQKIINHGQIFNHQEGSVLLSDLKHEGGGFVFSIYSMQTPCEQPRAGLSPPAKGSPSRGTVITK